VRLALTTCGHIEFHDPSSQASGRLRHETGCNAELDPPWTAAILAAGY